MGVFIKDEKLKRKLLTILDTSMFIMFLIFALTVHNFEKNCCEVYEYACPKSNEIVCYCYNISERYDEYGNYIITTNQSSTIPATTVGQR